MGNSPDIESQAGQQRKKVRVLTQRDRMSTGKRFFDAGPRERRVDGRGVLPGPGVWRGAASHPCVSERLSPFAKLSVCRMAGSVTN